MNSGSRAARCAIVAFIGLSLVVSTACVRAAEPANKKASAPTRAVLDYFQTLSKQQGGSRIISGQFSDFGPGASLSIMTRVYEKSGKWPAIIGVDYADLGKGGITTQAPNKAAIDYWKQGGLVTISAHMYNPANPKGGGLRDSGVNLDDLLKSGTETNQRWMKELDQIAEGLAELKQAGVVVLWRPFHEMNGGWFWWGDKDPQALIKVWRHMFDYYSNTKNLDNLIWVYGPNHGPKTAAFYAGAEYVDLVGLDAYTDFIDKAHIKGWDELVALGKPVGFTEFGPRDSKNPPGDYDYLTFLKGLQTNFPEACFFMTWNWKWSLAWNKNVKEMLSNPAVVNRDDLPKFVK